MDSGRRCNQSRLWQMKRGSHTLPWWSLWEHARGKGCHPEGPGQAWEVGPCKPSIQWPSFNGKTDPLLIKLPRNSWARGFESPHREAQAGVHLAWGRSDCWAIIKKCLVITCQLWLGWCGPLVLLAFTAFLCALRACLEECFVFMHLKAMPDQRPKTVEEVRKQKKEQNKSQRN